MPVNRRRLLWLSVPRGSRLWNPHCLASAEGSLDYITSWQMAMVGIQKRVGGHMMRQEVRELGWSQAVGLL